MATIQDLVILASAATPVFRGKWKLVEHTLRALGYSPETEFIGKMIIDGRIVRFRSRLESHIEKHAVVLGRYEPAESAVLNRLVKPGMVCVDVGANVRLHTMRMALRAQRVYAFEPNPEVRRRLEQNLALNNISNVDISPFALSNKYDEADLWRVQGSNRTASLVDDRDTTDEVKLPYSVQTRVLDTLPIQRPIHFIKLDIEGYELIALQGAERIIREDRPAILAEYCDYYARHMGFTEADFRSFMRGYSCSRISSDGLLFLPSN